MLTRCSNHCKKNPVEFLPQTHGRVMARNPSPKGPAPVFRFSYLCMNKVLVAAATETTGKANTRIPQNDWVPPPPPKHTACLSWFGVHPVCVKSCQLRTPTTCAQLIWPSKSHHNSWVRKILQLILCPTDVLIAYPFPAQRGAPWRAQTSSDSQLCVTAAEQRGRHYSVHELPAPSLPFTQCHAKDVLTHQRILNSSESFMTKQTLSVWDHPCKVKRSRLK